MKVRSLASLAGAAVLGLGGFLACSSSDITGVDRHSARGDDKSSLLGIINPKLVTCPSTTTVADTSLVTALGGIVSVGGTAISIPAGALLEPATVIVTVPASNYMEVDISVQGTSSFLFELPVTVSVNYSRCTSWVVRLFPNTAWHIDSETKAMLEAMPSIDNKLTRTVTFTTGHLSGYALAN